VIDIAGRVEGGELVLTVRDNGVGIEPEAQSRIFTPFYTTKEVGRGMGMGLTITRRCVVALGGSVQVRSQRGAGTEFTLRFPRAQKPIGSTLQPSGTTLDTTPRPAGSRPVA
jgi:signal transduction histidine kinase